MCNIKNIIYYIYKGSSDIFGVSVNFDRIVDMEAYLHVPRGCGWLLEPDAFGQNFVEPDGFFVDREFLSVDAGQQQQFLYQVRQTVHLMQHGINAVVELAVVYLAL